MLDRHAEILKTLRAAPVVVRALTGRAGEPGLRRRPAPGQWAIIEVVGHLADTEEHALSRVGAMITQDNPYLAPFDPETLAAERHYLGLDLASEISRLDRLRAEHLAELEALSEGGWQRTGRHGEHGQMTIELYETHVAAEEVDHLAQIARLV